MKMGRTAREIIVEADGMNVMDEAEMTGS